MPGSTGRADNYQIGQHLDAVHGLAAVDSAGNEDDNVEQ